MINGKLDLVSEQQQFEQYAVNLFVLEQFHKDWSVCI